MKKLEKRQIIILAVAALFVLYAVYELLIAGPAAKKARTETQPVKIESFINDMNSNIMKYQIAGSEIHIVKRAETNWGKSPFWEQASYREFAGNEAGSGIVAKIIYSGYVDTGGKQLAIINGVEYEAGEKLEIEGYVLKSVSPSRILILNRNTDSELNISIQE